jgi:dihydroxyacetone kinase-like protein
MSEILDLKHAARMLNAAVAQIRQHHEMLSRLDSVIGDGDHGATMLRVGEAITRIVAENTTKDFKQFMASIAWAVMSCDGGATGPLLGAFFSGMSGPVTGKSTLDFTETIHMFEAGIAKLHQQSRAQMGDKTMMDAWLPALAALKAADPAKGLHAAFHQAALAAAQGAEATKTMRAKFGRARHLGERTLGHPDPGAISISLLFEGFTQGLA